MKIATYEQILSIVQKTNILPIISTCNIKCEFCSHKNNPEDLDVYTLPKLTNEQVRELIEYLSPDEKIVIGESASRIVEGEPFLYKGFMYILKLIREKYKDTLIQITTNGSFLSEDVIKELSDLEPIEINLSLNSSCPENRSRLIKDKNPKIAIDSCKLLRTYNINYNGSLVVMPNITGYDDIRNTITYLCENGAGLVRVFIPGYTRYSEMTFSFEDLYAQSINLVREIRKKFDNPIVVEPPVIENLNADIEGIIKESPAFASGLSCGDIITKVDHAEVKSRVDAFNTSYKRKNPIIEFVRNGKIYSTMLKKEKKQSPGFVMNYDIDPSIIDEIQNKIIKNKSKKTFLITSELGSRALNLIIKEVEHDIEIVAIPNNYFGGSIKVNGLLTVDDILNTLTKKIKESKADLIILPSIPFDFKGYDLKSEHYLKIQEETHIKVEII